MKHILFLTLLFNLSLGAAWAAPEATVSPEQNLEILAGKGMPIDQYNYGDFLISEKKELLQGLDWYEKAAEQGHVPAMKKLGFYYKSGSWGSDILKRKPRLALKWTEAAARNGDRSSLYDVALMYHHGFGDEWPDFQTNMNTANQWYLKAANLGHPASLVHILRLYLDYKDYANAHLAANRLIEAKKADGYFYKAMMAENGWGMARDLSRARTLYQQAADKHHRRAKIALKRLATHPESGKE